jgi:uncharacterized protein (TIGR02594 family)
MIFPPQRIYLSDFLTPGERMYLEASRFMGLTEIPGEQHNPQILTFFQDIGKSWVQTDETAWCSAFINYIAKISGVEYTGELNARSWLEIGQEVQTAELGDLAVYWREDPESWKGHVGLWAGENVKHIWTLGGNQNGQVNIKLMPQYRKLKYIRLGYVNKAA